MSYTMDNLGSFGVWFLEGPDSYASYNFVREVRSASFSLAAA
jgi:hypothetical protein